MHVIQATINNINAFVGINSSNTPPREINRVLLDSRNLQDSWPTTILPSNCEFETPLYHVKCRWKGTFASRFAGKQVLRLRDGTRLHVSLLHQSLPDTFILLALSETAD